MKLEQQVISLDLAKRLKELGVKQESSFWWRDGAGVRLMITGYEPSIDTSDIYRSYAAFTVAELGEMLPNSVSKGDGVFYLACCKFDDWWEVNYDVEGKNLYILSSDTEAQARGLMLAYLIENNLLSV